MSNPY